MVYYSMGLENRTVEQQMERRQIKPIRIFRIIILVGLLLCAFMIGAFVNVFANSDIADDEQAATVIETNNRTFVEHNVNTIDVRPGDSLWSIAKVHAPGDTDVRYYIEQMMQLNNLQDHVVHVGQILSLP